MFNTGSRLTVYGSRLKRLKDYHENTRIRQGLILRGSFKGVRLSLLALLGLGFAADWSHAKALILKD